MICKCSLHFVGCLLLIYVSLIMSFDALKFLTLMESNLFIFSLVAPAFDVVSKNSL